MTKSETKMSDATDVSAHSKALSLLRDRYQLNVSSTKYDGNKVQLRGWITPAAGRSGMECVGAGVENFEYPLRLERLAEIFHDDSYSLSGYRLSLAYADGESNGGINYLPGYALLRPVASETSHDIRIANSWVIPAPGAVFVSPPDENIVRVTGKGSASSYIYGGATHAYRMVEAVVSVGGRQIDEFKRVADWGCGAGRLAQHFARVWPGRVTGLDVDPTNIDWCKQNLPDVDWVQIPWSTPTQCPSNSFDLLFAFSVFSHIHHSRIEDWLDELHRVLKPGGAAVITTLGSVSTASRGSKTAFYEELQRVGFVEWRNQGQLDDVRPSEDDYLNIAMSLDYASNVFGKQFDVLGVVEGLGPQDAWVLQAR